MLAGIRTYGVLKLLSQGLWLTDLHQFNGEVQGDHCWFVCHKPGRRSSTCTHRCQFVGDESRSCQWVISKPRSVAHRPAPIGLVTQPRLLTVCVPQTTAKSYHFVQSAQRHTLHNAHRLSFLARSTQDNKKQTDEDIKYFFDFGIDSYAFQLFYA